MLKKINFNIMTLMTVIMLTVTFFACGDDVNVYDGPVIEVISGPETIIYIVGEPFDPTGIELITYDDEGNTEPIALNDPDLKFEYDFSKPGTDKIVTIKYKGKVFKTIAVKVYADEGDGTAAKPFLTRNPEALQYVGRGTANPEGYKTWTLSAHYAQTTNITLPAVAAGESNWTPSSSTFTVKYDGNGRTITGLTISSTSSYQGLFGVIGTGGEVKNLSLKGCDIKGGSYVGGIAGQLYGTIQNCNVEGDVSGATNVGGVVGTNRGTIQDCSAAGNVRSSSNGVGGVAGYNYGTLRGSYSTCNVGVLGGYSSIGGVAGSNEALIEYCYATGNVEGKNYVGGVVGESKGATNIVQFCYATGDVKGESYTGGVMGNNESGGIVQNCYATGNIEGTSYTGGVMGTNGTNGASILQNCYATGNINCTGSRIGGVVGENWSDKTTQNCVALNKIVATSSIITDQMIGRVAGLNYTTGVVINCYGLSDMSIISSLYSIPGTDVTPAQALTQSWWTGTAKWSTSIWNISNGKLPTLKNMPGNPTQDPQLK